MKKVRSVLVLFLCAVLVLISTMSIIAYPGGSINPVQLTESATLDIIAAALKDHVTYAQTIYHDNNAYIPGTGYFHTGNSGEDGVRTNADYALMYAFLYYKFPDATFSGVPRLTIRDRAIAAFKYAFNTHQTGSYTCKDGLKWGRQWESSLWTQALGMAAWLLWSDLVTTTQNGVKTMVTNEANYNAGRTPPTNEWSDTKAEENGWDTNILALAKGMWPADPNAGTWDNKMKSFAMNTYSTLEDEQDTTVVDGDTVQNWVLGANLHPDFAMENHDIFHPIYEMVPVQELTESAVFYAKAGLAVPGSLAHNVMNVWNNVLKKIVVADAEWAYPNGIDWSIHDYEHLEAYSALATKYQDVDAKFLESRLVQYMRARQLTTSNKSFLLNPDVGARRHGVIAHRLVYAYLMHDYFGPVPASTTTWDDLENSQRTTKLFPYNKIIRNLNSQRYTAFSWQKSFMGIVMPKSATYLDTPYVTNPFKTGNTGGLTGYYDVSGKTRNATYQSNTYAMTNDSFATTGYITEDDASLDHYIACAAAPGNPVVYMDVVKAKGSITVTKEGGIMLGVESDTIGGDPRTLYYNGGSQNSNGSTLVSIPGNWVNIDNKLGMIVSGGQGITFGERELKNSVYLAKLYGSYSTASRGFNNGDIVASRMAVIYSNVSNTTMSSLNSDLKYPAVSAGWKGIAVKDPNGRRYLVLGNFYGGEKSTMTHSYTEGAPVLTSSTAISGSSGTATVVVGRLAAQIQEMGCYITASTGLLKAVQGSTPYQAYIKNDSGSTVTATVKIWDNGSYLTGTQNITAGVCYLAQVSGGAVTFNTATYPGDYRMVSKGKYVTATSHEGNYLPYNAIDGDTANFWVSLNAPSISVPQYLTMDPQGNYRVDQVSVRSRANYGPKDVAVEVSYNGSTYTQVASSTLPNSEGPHNLTFTGTDARYVRLKITSGYNSRNVQVKEMEAYGTPRVNINLGKTITATSSQASYPPSSANDGKKFTFWVSQNAPQTSTQYLTCNLDATYSLNKVDIYPRANYGPKNVAVEVSTNGTSYSQVASAVLPNSEGPHSLPFTAVNASYIRLKITSSYDTQVPSRNVQVEEFEAYLN